MLSLSQVFASTNLPLVMYTLFLPCPSVFAVLHKVWGSTDPTNLKHVLLQKRAMGIISKSCYGAYTEPIFKTFCILLLNDMYLAEIGKTIFLYKIVLLPDVFNNMFL